MRQIVLISFRVFLLVFLISLFGGFSGGPPTAKSGAPGDGNCGECHGGGSQTGLVEIGGIPTPIVPGLTYNLTVSVTWLTGSAFEPQTSRGGFQLVALDGNDSSSPSTGTYSNLEPNFVKTSTSGNRTYIEHDNDKFFNQIGEPVVFTADWTAPLTSTDNIYFYAIANVANGSGSGGDEIVTTSQGPIPLPVELAEFNVTQINDQTLELKWKTLSEQNSSHFNILRSKNGVAYDVIGKVEAAGQSSKELEYRFQDENPPKNRTLFYRLQQFDLDDQMSYSPIRTAELLNAQETVVNVFPNPITIGQCLFIESVAQESLQKPELHIYRQDGSLAYQDFTPTIEGFHEGFNRYVVESSNWEKGLYYLCISERGKPVITKSFIVID